MADILQLPKMRIWKYSLLPAGVVKMNMPKGAKVLAVQVQAGEPRMWVLCDEGQPSEERSFCVYGTGHPLPADPGQYIGTFQVNGGALVFHIFEPTFVL